MLTTTLGQTIRRFAPPIMLLIIAQNSFAINPSSLRRLDQLAPTEAAIAEVNPFSTNYALWSARWWQWAFSIPLKDTSGVIQHPLLTSGEVDCSLGQSGPIWLLAGNLTGGSTSRTCTVGRAKSLLIPILNSWCDNVGVDAPTSLSIPELQNCAASFFVDPIDGTTVKVRKSLFVEVDGRSIPLSDANRGASLFAYLVPNGNNLLEWFGAEVPGPGWPYGKTPVGTIVGPAAADGYWLLLPPLAPGKHTICFGGTSANGFSLHITYNLNVK